jgi:hypothetical protein
VLRIRDVYPDPDFYPSLIPDPDLTTATKKEGNFLTATNMSKIKIIFF